MKTAISIPDDIFERAERFARREGISRSRLYSKAVCTFVAAQQRENVTQRLNRVYKDQDSSLDPALNLMQLSLLDDERW